MTKSRMAVLGAVAAFALLLVGGAGPAAAQTSKPLTQVVKMTGTAKNGKQFRGTYTIQRFTHRGDQVLAVGTFKGQVGNRRVKRTDVRIPVDVARQGAKT